MTVEERVLRQIHPNWWKENQICLEAFNPSSAHGYKLSVDDGRRITPKEAFANYTRENGSARSVGVGVVLFDTCQTHGLPVKADPIEANPHHMLIDFSVCVVKSERRKKALILRDEADRYGMIKCE